MLYQFCMNVKVSEAGGQPGSFSADFHLLIKTFQFLCQNYDIPTLIHTGRPRCPALPENFLGCHQYPRYQRDITSSIRRKINTVDLDSDLLETIQKNHEYKSLYLGNMFNSILLASMCMRIYPAYIYEWRTEDTCRRYIVVNGRFL